MCLPMFPRNIIYSSALDILDKNRQLVAQLSDKHHTIDNNAPATVDLVKLALQGHATSTLQQVPSTSGSYEWMLDVAVPIVDQNNAPKGVLIAAQVIDDDFALSLVQDTAFNVVLCQENRVL